MLSLRPVLPTHLWASPEQVLLLTGPPVGVATGQTHSSSSSGGSQRTAAPSRACVVRLADRARGVMASRRHLRSGWVGACGQRCLLSTVSFLSPVDCGVVCPGRRPEGLRSLWKKHMGGRERGLWGLCWLPSPLGPSGLVSQPGILGLLIELSRPCAPSPQEGTGFPPPHLPTCRWVSAFLVTPAGTCGCAPGPQDS